MKLRLSVKRYRNSAPDSPVWADFSERGGTLGRGERSDWVLADPEVSHCHARVFFLDGQFQLEDTSTNGICVKNSTQPLGLGNTIPLNQRDTLTLSDYEILVDVVPSGDEVSADQAASASGWLGEEEQLWDQEPFSEPTPFPTSPRSSIPEDEEQLSPIPKLPEAADISLRDVGSASDHIPGHEGYMEEAPTMSEEIPEDIFLGLVPNGEPSEPSHSLPEEPITEAPRPPPDEWLCSCENLSLAVLNDEIDLSAFDEGPLALPTPNPERRIRFDAPRSPDSAMSWEIPLPPEGMRKSFADILAAMLLRHVFPVYSLWWTHDTQEAGHSILITQGLPAGSRFAAMLDGNWKTWGWYVCRTLSGNATDTPAQSS